MVPSRGHGRLERRRSHPPSKRLGPELGAGWWEKKEQFCRLPLFYFPGGNREGVLSTTTIPMPPWERGVVRIDLR